MYHNVTINVVDIGVGKTMLSCRNENMDENRGGKEEEWKGGEGLKEREVGRRRCDPHVSYVTI